VNDGSGKSSGAASERAILDALATEISVPPVPIAYRFSLAVVAAAMILLPLLYVALVAATGYALYWHATTNFGRFVEAGARAGLLAYVAPLVAGTILVLFMVKPLFAAPAVEARAVRMRRRDAPFLFAFVERLCETLGAPVPSRIEADVLINASAGMHLDMVRMSRGKTVLTIGLPLLTGLDLRQLAGVLAHEFGHFRQGSAMTVSQLIRRVNGWFWRVVYERDEWDERLEVWSKAGSSLVVVIWLARLFVWLSRRVLWVLMTVGHCISCFLMRQMEYDADQYEAEIAGSDTFGRTAMRLRVLGAASQMVYGELSDAWNEGRLVDDLPSLIAGRARSLPAEVQKAIQSASLEQGTGLFDTHPSDRSRVQRARRPRRAGTFAIEAPATTLIRDFPSLARRVTLAHYKQVLGGHVSARNLVSLADFEKTRAEQSGEDEAFVRYFQGLVSSERMVDFGTESAPATAGAAVTTLQAARERLVAALPAGRLGYQRIGKAHGIRRSAAHAGSLLDVGMQINASSFDTSSADADGVRRLRERAERLVAQATPAVEEVDRLVRSRLHAALAALSEPAVQTKLPDGAARVDQARSMLAAAGHLHEALELIVQLQDQHCVLDALLGNLQEDDENDRLREAISKQMTPLMYSLAGLQERFNNVAYPFPQAGEAMSVGEYLLSVVPRGDDLQGLYEVGQGALDRFFRLYARVLGRLAVIAEEVEAAVGLRPMRSPEPKRSEPS